MSYRFVGEEKCRGSVYRIFKCAHCGALLVLTQRSFGPPPKTCAKCKA